MKKTSITYRRKMCSRKKGMTFDRSASKYGLCRRKKSSRKVKSKSPRRRKSSNRCSKMTKMQKKIKTVGGMRESCKKRKCTYNRYKGGPLGSCRKPKGKPKKKSSAKSKKSTPKQKSSAKPKKKSSSMPRGFEIPKTKMPEPTTSKCVKYLKLMDLDSSKDVSMGELKKRYYKLAKELHPDKGGDAEKFKALNEAYSFAKEYCVK